MQISQHKIAQFQNKILDNYIKNKRDLPWRHTTDPYKILVSEIMLQQTQVSRGLKKYPEFISAFPDIKTLAKAALAEVLKIWLGLGYNRRAKYLKQISEIVMRDFNGKIPVKQDVLDSFPGIGPNTAAAIVVYNTNKPVVFIETNIRKIYIQEFFSDKTNIDDADILPIIETTLLQNSPRIWYWALMDYGAHLSKIKSNSNRLSKHYHKQSKFKGSLRQSRGIILKALLDRSKLSHAVLKKIVPETVQYEIVISQLKNEGLVIIENEKVSLAP